MFIQFMIDCSVIPEIISLAQTFDDDILYDLLKISLTWWHSLHRERMKMADGRNFSLQHPSFIILYCNTVKLENNNVVAHG